MAVRGPAEAAERASEAAERASEAAEWASEVLVYSAFKELSIPFLRVFTLYFCGKEPIAALSPNHHVIIISFISMSDGNILRLFA